MAATKPGKSPAWGRWLEARRREQGLSQRKLAGQSHGTVSPAQIQRWETGAEATVEDVVNTCTALGIPVTEFLVAAGFINPEDVGIPVRVRVVAGLPKRDLIALRREVDDELDDRIPDDDEQVVSVDHLTPFLRRHAQVVTPDGEEGHDWAALDRQK